MKEERGRVKRKVLVRCEQNSSFASFSGCFALAAFNGSQQLTPGFPFPQFAQVTFSFVGG